MSLAPFLAELSRGAEGAWLASQDRHPDLLIEVVPEIGSTNTELMDRARQGRQDKTLLVAAHQTAGRGRMGRQWQDQAGQSLMFSLGMPCTEMPGAGLSLVVGASLAPAMGEAVRLKWPNDLWWSDQGHWKKLGGILVEVTQVAGQTYLVIGAGINLLPQEVVPGHSKALPAVSLRDMGYDATPAALLTRIVPSLLDDVTLFLSEGFGPFLERFKALDALRGLPVSWGNDRTGIAAGVQGDGALLIQVGDKIEAIYSQEVSVRPC